MEATKWMVSLDWGLPDGPKYSKPFRSVFLSFTCVCFLMENAYFIQVCKWLDAGYPEKTVLFAVLRGKTRDVEGFLVSQPHPQKTQSILVQGHHGGLHRAHTQQQYLYGREEQACNYKGTSGRGMLIKSW